MRDPGLEGKIEDRRRKIKEKQLENEEINKKIAATDDYKKVKALEELKNQNFDKITELDKEVLELERESDEQSLGGRLDALVSILQRHESCLPQFLTAYRETVSHWPNAVQMNIDVILDIVIELERLDSAFDGYEALEYFVSCLVKTVKDTFLLPALKEWCKIHCSGRDVIGLYNKVKLKVEERNRKQQPAILIFVKTDENEAAKKKDKRYRLLAWLVEDIHLYQQQFKSGDSDGQKIFSSIGCQSLIQPETDVSQQLLSSDELVDKVEPLLIDWVATTPQRRVKPEVYVFLPKDLLRLEVEHWSLGSQLPASSGSSGPESSTSSEQNNTGEENQSSASESESFVSLGQNHAVTLCCTNRLEGPYAFIDEWRDFWTQWQSSRQLPSTGVFINGSNQDIDALSDLLNDALDKLYDEAGQALPVPVGLRLSQVCSPDVLEECFEEILAVGLPVALWGRCSEFKDSNEEILSRIFNAKLQDLANVVKRERLKARKECRKTHIGQNISLLQDNPYLLPPPYLLSKTAS